jgi:hypothetical protein
MRVLDGRSPRALEHRLAPVIDTDRAPLRAVRHKRRELADKAEAIGELGVRAVLPDEPLDLVSLAALAWCADDAQERVTRSFVRFGFGAKVDEFERIWAGICANLAMAIGRNGGGPEARGDLGRRCRWP